MSKPKSSIRDYGYNPNQYDSLYDMETTVPTSGMQARKVEKHSEFMSPNDAATYSDMEDVYPYPPSTTQPPEPWPVAPGYNWPPTGGPEEYRVFKCVANCCCCSGNLIGPVEISCTYPIVVGPWVKNTDGSKCDTGKKDTGANLVSVCMNPCGDGNCPPDVRCVIEAPAIKSGDKVKYPAERREVKVTMLEKCGKVGNPSCPPASACCTGVSISGMTQMNVGTSQTLTVLNPVAGCTYEFRKSAGGGTLSNGVYSAPATNAGCTSNATIGLYDKTNCVICSTITITINAYTNPATPAVGVFSRYGCETEGGVTSCYTYYNIYNCAGILLGEGDRGQCQSGWDGRSCKPGESTFPDGCGGGSHVWPGEGCCSSFAECASHIEKVDKRDAAMIAAGCCPSQLL